MSPSPAHLLVALFLMMVFYKTCKASHVHQNCYSLCGDHNVSSPFRLKDFPEKCGDHKYNLSCEQKKLVLYLQSGRYSVLSINYANYTIRVKDANVMELDYSSLPRDSLTDYNFSLSDDPYTTFTTTRYGNARWEWNRLTGHIIYVRCQHHVGSPLYVDTAPCFKTSNGSVASSSASYLYAKVGGLTAGELGLEDDCRIELMYMMMSWSPINNHSWTCTDIHNIFLHGFELSWLNSFCLKSGGEAHLDQSKQPRCDTAVSIFEDILSYARGRDSCVVGEYICTTLVFHAGGRFVLGTPVVIVLLIYKWRRRHLSMYENIEDFLQSDNNIMPIRYSYRDIKKMTKGFKIKLGKGGYGSVFKGQLRSGRYVAVKMLDKANSNGEEFINEVATLGRIHHVNVVRLIGYCVEGSKHALIYEYMQNGSLDKYIL